MNKLSENDSYMYGLFLADAHLQDNSRNRGKLTLEIKSSDVDILFKLKEIIPFNSTITIRNRVTNFGKITTSCIRICDIGFRDWLKSFGFPVGKKSDICDLPNCEFSEKDFWRGFIDGDGSIGITKNNIPFISVVTKSENIKTKLCSLIERLTGFSKNVSRNKRDDVYNIMVTNENAQKIVEFLRYDLISIDRKKEKAMEVLSWIRPIDRVKKELVTKKEPFH